ncbi:MAG TPA: hypothetical protein VGK10_10265 [Prolixibacteraceae bacterium]|jgi:hypothetical protein
MNIRTVILFLLFVQFGQEASAQQTIPRDEIYKLLKKKGIVDTLKYNVSVSKQVILANTTFKVVDVSVTSPGWNSWFFLIDMNPFTTSRHPYKYIFVNNTDATIITTTASIPDKSITCFPTDQLLCQKISSGLMLPAPFIDKRSTSKK